MHNPMVLLWVLYTMESSLSVYVCVSVHELVINFTSCGYI